MRFAFFPLTPGTGNISKEMLMAATLATHGDQALIVTCDGIQERCSLLVTQPPNHQLWQEVCQSCHKGQTLLNRHAVAGPVTRTDMSHLIDPARQFAAHRAVAQTPDEDLLTFFWDDQPFGQWIQTSMRAEHYGEYWRDQADFHARARQWLRSAINAYLATEGCIHQYRPDCVIVMNGIVAAERAVWECARRMGVRHITYEMGQRPHTMILREHQPVALYDFSDEFADWRHYPLSAAETHRLDQLIQRRQRTGGEADYVWSPHATGNMRSLIQRLDLDPHKPIISLFTNVTADSSVFAANDVFTNQVDWLWESIRLAEARPEIQLVIRVHPAELTNPAIRYGERILTRDPATKLVHERYPQLPPNVRLLEADDQTSSYDLLQLSSAALVYVSTIGIEAAACGLPVLVAGKSHYRDLGFTWSIRDPETYATQLDRLIQSPSAPPGAVELARRYLYLYYFRGCYHLPALHFLHSLDERPDDPAGFLAGYRRILELANSPHPDQAHIRHYLRGEVPFVPPPPAWRLRQDPLGTLSDRSQILLLPDWAKLDHYISMLFQPASKWMFPVTFNFVNQTLPMPEAASQIATALRPIGPAASWPDIELLSAVTTPQAWGSILHGIHACLYDPDHADPTVLGLAQQLAIPCIPLTPALMEPLLQALPHSDVPMSQAAIYFE